MSVSASIPATVQIRRTHLLGLIGVAAALAACVTWAVTAFAFDTGTSGAMSSSQAAPSRVGAAQHSPATFTMTREQIEGLSTIAQQTQSHADPVMLKGFEVRVLGSSPRAGRFAGFGLSRMGCAIKQTGRRAGPRHRVAQWPSDPNQGARKAKCSGNCCTAPSSSILTAT